MKVLMSAYACEPGRGSEPGAGWAWACAAARKHDVWVLTHATNRPSVDAALATDPELAGRLHPVYLRNRRWARPLRRRGPSRFLYYWIWQLGPCRRESRRLHGVLAFDVCHHLSYAADWMPAGVSVLRDVPFVWGPVGGSSTTGGVRMWLKLGPRALVQETLRAAVLGCFRALVGRRLASRAAIVLGQNPDVAAAFAPTRVVVQPNIAIDPGPASDTRRPDTRPPTAAFAGRLLRWKGLRLALAALQAPEAAEWHLEVYGDGPDRQHLMRLCSRRGLSGRVRFHGSLPRPQVLRALADADVLLFPSVHDSAGWAVAEAMSLGLPVVCLRSGGPPALIQASDGVTVDLDGDVVAGLAAGLGQAAGLQPVRDRWSTNRLPDLLDRFYAEATSASAVGTAMPC